MNYNATKSITRACPSGTTFRAIYFTVLYNALLYKRECSGANFLGVSCIIHFLLCVKSGRFFWSKWAHSNKKSSGWHSMKIISIFLFHLPVAKNQIPEAYQTLVSHFYYQNQFCLISRVKGIIYVWKNWKKKLNLCIFDTESQLQTRRGVWFSRCTFHFEFEADFRSQLRYNFGAYVHKCSLIVHYIFYYNGVMSCIPEVQFSLPVTEKVERNTLI